MTDSPRSQAPDGPVEPTADDPMATLLQRAGKRPRPSASWRAEMHEVARTAWRQSVTTRRPPRRTTSQDSRISVWARRALPLAAGLVLAVGLGYLLGRGDTASPSGVGSNGETSNGEATSSSTPAIGRIEARFGANGDLMKSLNEALTADGVIHAGASLRTGSRDRMAIRLDGDLMVRLDTQTRLRAASATTLILDQGAIYVDTGSTVDSAPQDAALEIRTPVGTAFDIGTRFEARLTSHELQIRVRDGMVDVVPVSSDATAARHRADTGSMLRLGADGEVSRSPIGATDQAWAWTLQAAPPFEVDGKTLHEVLSWVGRETGWQIRYADDDLEAAARVAITHGSAAGLSANEVPDLVVPVSGWSYRIVDNSLLVER